MAAALVEPEEAWPGAAERLAAKRGETLGEVRLYELRRAEAVSQVDVAGRLDVTQGAISMLEHADDVRVFDPAPVPRSPRARLELVAVFEDEDRGVSINLGRESAA